MTIIKNPPGGEFTEFAVMQYGASPEHLKSTLDKLRRYERIAVKASFADATKIDQELGESYQTEWLPDEGRPSFGTMFCVATNCTG